MAFVSNMQDDNQKTDQSLAPQGAVSPVGGGAAVRLSPSSAMPSGGTSGSAPTPVAGGQFASLNQYLSANQGQAEPLASKITSGVGQQYTNLAGQNASTLNDISGQVAAGGVPSNANSIISQEAANPVSFASNSSNIPSFQKLLGATYSGPTSAESTPGFTAQQNAVNSAINAGQQATKTEAGRENLISQSEATPTAGVTALNSAILSQSPEALGSVEKAYDPFANLLTGLSSGAQGINKDIAAAQANTAQANQAANQQIASQVGALNTNVSKELADATAARDAYNAAVQQNQNVWNPINTQVNSIDEILANATKGLTPVAGGAATIDNPFGQYVNAPISATAPTLQTVATPEDYAKAQAFQNLLAGLNTGIAVPTLNPADMAQAGTYVAPTAPTITDPKAEAQAIYDAMNRTIGAPSPTNPNLQVANPWTQNPDVFQQLNPQYANLGRLLNAINPAVYHQ